MAECSCDNALELTQFPIQRLSEAVAMLSEYRGVPPYGDVNLEWARTADTLEDKLTLIDRLTANVLHLLTDTDVR